VVASVVVSVVAAIAPLVAPATPRADARKTRVAVVDVATGAEQTVLRRPIQTRGWDSVRFAPDGGVRAVRDAVLDPQGRRVAGWRDDGAAVVEIRTLDGSASPKRIRLGAGRMNGGEAAWSPDGRRVAVAWTRYADDEPRVTVVDVEAGRRMAARRLPGEFDLTEQAWSPDSRHLAFSVETYHFLDDPDPLPHDKIARIHAGDETTTRDELRVLDVETGRVRVEARPDGSFLGPAWSSSGRLAGVFEFQQLSLVDAGRLRRVPLAEDWCDEVHALAWSPDGASLAVATSADFGNDDVRLAVVAADGSAPERLLRTIGKGEVDTLAWSPDGARIAYAITGHRP
jgi:Tol biopolymer transport system component